MSDCIFCKIIAGDIPATRVYEDEKVLAFLDIQPVNPGHLLVLPKGHFAHLHEMDEETGAHVFRAGMRLERALRGSGLRCEGANLLLNNGKVAGQEVFHVHLHVIPRFADDGNRFVFNREKPGGDQLAKVGAAIREALV